MKVLRLSLAMAAISALILLAAGKAPAQTQVSPAPRLELHGVQVSPPAHPGHMGGVGHGFRGFFPGFFYAEPEVVHDVVYVHDAPAEPPPSAGPPPPRKPFVLGRTYSSLPGGCMKMIDRGITYYQCSGEWYRQLGGGRGGPYRAVAQP